MSTRVLIFDSGVGALTIARELAHTAPQLERIIAMDSGGFPYGAWPETDLQQRICLLATRLIERYAPDIFVVACNTLSTTALPALRAITDIPVVGVVPAIKPAAALSQSRVIGLLATPGTVQRGYTDQLIADFAPDCQVLRVGSAELVAAVENLYRDDIDASDVCRAAIDSFGALPRAAEMDTLVLACTHFPLVAGTLRAHAPGVVHWVDSAAAIARRIVSLVGEGGGSPQHRAVMIDTPAVPATLRGHLGTLEVGAIDLMDSAD